MYDVLVAKQQDVLNDVVPKVSLSELDMLLDEDQLRALKYYKNPNPNYVPAVDEEDCISKIKSGDEIYRTLELLIRKIAVLKSVTEIFSMYGGLFCD